MTTMEGSIIMEDTDRNWLQRELDEIKRRQYEGHIEVRGRLDALPCQDRGDRLVSIERGHNNHITQHRERWSKAQIIIVIILSLGAIVGWVPKVIAILSKLSK